MNVDLVSKGLFGRRGFSWFVVVKIFNLSDGSHAKFLMQISGEKTASIEIICPPPHFLILR